MEGTLEHARLHQEKRNRRQAATLSALLFVTVLVACFFLTAFTTQEPPPGERFVAVGFADLGSTEEAGGDVETEVPSEIVQEAVEEEALSNEPEQPMVQEEVVTQATSDVAVQSAPDPKPDPEPDPEPEREDRTAHLFRNPGAQSAGGGGSQGVASGVGNEGDEAGKIEGRGLVSGDFGDAMLRGGTMIGEPKLDEKPRQEGSVRINIVVDASGSVIQAVPDYQSALTTIRDSHHVQLAMRAAKTAKFDSDATKPRRSGYITIRFDLE